MIPVTVINPRMIGGENLTAIAMDGALLMIVAIGQMPVMLTRNIDLCVASVIVGITRGVSWPCQPLGRRPADQRRSGAATVT
jgi:ribose/xylose/arabinose/galactoside ABC-type transport system permease subunit